MITIKNFFTDPVNRTPGKKTENIGGKSKSMPSPAEHPTGTASGQLSIHSQSIYLSILVMLFASAWFG